jgi:hypothetical protein
MRHAPFEAECCYLLLFLSASTTTDVKKAYKAIHRVSPKTDLLAKVLRRAHRVRSPLRLAGTRSKIITTIGLLRVAEATTSYPSFKGRA